MKAKAAKTILLLLTAFACFSLAPFGATKHGARPALASSQNSSQVSFDRDIRPILAARCLNCHGEKKQNGGLRLDAKAPAMRGGQGGRVIVAGKATESRLYQRVTAPNDEQRMPPTGERLSLAEVSALKAWVDAGAVWPEGDSRKGRLSDGATPARSDLANDQSRHWAWRPIKRPAVAKIPPGTRNRRPTTRNPIDSFIAARLAQAGLKMSPEADRRTLIRRLSFDLLGLPPTPERAQAFINDRDPRAYEKLVDEMLRSPRYGSAGRGIGWTSSITATRTATTRPSPGRTHGLTA